MRRNEKFFAEKAERDAQRKAVMRETAGEPYHKEVSLKRGHGLFVFVCAHTG